MKSILALVLAMALASGAIAQQGKKYDATWESLDKRPTPAWFDEGKFGIFIHWGVYSVPAWGPKGKYAEWYWSDMQKKDGETWKYHAKTYGEKFQYQDFAPMFKAEMFDPAQWADVFAKSGAKYVVLTSKHHEGFCLWPSPQSWNWNAGDIGPHRDLAGDLITAVKSRGLRMGYYYSLYEWFNPLYKSDVNAYVDQHMLPQLKDLVTRYKPDLVWTDGEWDHPDTTWRSTEFLAWLFNESPVKDEVAVNDRWGKDVRSHHGGFYTTEYGSIDGKTPLAEQHKWEECRGLGASFGYNRNEDASDYKSTAEQLQVLIDTVSKGGNLLLDIGPTGDGRIPVIMQQRLIEMGDWLKVNGEAIYGTHPWRVTSDGASVRYTSKDGVVYAICLKWPGADLALPAIKATDKVAATLVGRAAALACKNENGVLHVAVPPLTVDEVPCRHAYVIKLTGVE